VSGDADICLIKTDTAGNLQWTKNYGDAGNDYSSLILPTEGGYMIVGSTQVIGKGADILIVRTDLQGNIIWKKNCGGTSDEGASSIIQIQSGDYIVTGATSSYGAGGYDIFIMKMDGNGNIYWFKTYGSQSTERAGDILEESDGSMIVTGQDFGYADYDVLLLKTDSQGNILWAKTYSGNGDEFGHRFIKADNGDYLIVGESNGWSTFDDPAILYRIDNTGNLKWAQIYSAPVTVNFARSVLELSDGGIVVGGRWSGSYSDYFTSSGYIMKTDSYGNVLWCREYSGMSTEFSYDIIQTKGGGYVTGGRTNKSGTGDYDCYLVKTDSIGMVDTCGNLVLPVFWSPSVGVHNATLTTTVVDPGPNFILDVSALNFGYVHIGGSLTMSVVVTNVATTNALLITEITFPANYSVVPNPPGSYPIIISPGASQRFDVTFTPSSEGGPYQGDIAFVHNAAGGTTNLAVTAVLLTPLYGQANS
jgi:hypothetical protein